MNEVPGSPAMPSDDAEPTVTISRARIYELLAHLVASADICAREPGYYGTFRLLDAAGRLAGAVLDGGLSDPWLTELHEEIDRNKLLMMSDRPAYYAYLPEVSGKVAQRLVETGFASGDGAGS
jgi:Family of unknown function (DUF6092)